MVRRLLPLILLSATMAIMVLGCSDDDDSGTGPIATALKAVAVSQAPAIDGSVDAVWGNATAFNVKAGVNGAYQAIFGEVDIMLKAVTYNNNLYVLAQWDDPASGGATESIHKKMWSFAGGEWSKRSADEDRFFLIFDASDNGTEGADCATMCHKPEQGSMATTGGGHVDVWHWKAARTNPSNAGSPGRADDKWWDGTGRVSDAKDASWYIDNTQDDGNDGAMPLYMHTSGVNYTGDFLFDADKADFDSNLDWEGKSIPFYVINPAATGSRWDVQAKGVYSSGTWTVEFCRALNTGHADDVVLGSGTVQMTAAVTDNSGGNHSGTEPFDLEF